MNEKKRQLIYETGIKRIDFLTQEILYPTTEGFYFEPFHFEWQRWILGCRKSLFLAPRGSIKTTALNIAKNVYKILQNFILEDKRNIMIGIGSEVKGKATAMVMAIRRHFESPRFQAIYSDLRGEIWREDQLTFRGAKLQEKEANVTAFGMDSSAVNSMHFTDLDLDDVVSFENSTTMQSRDKMMNRFLFDVLPTLEPDSDQKSLNIFGTRFHPDDLYGREIKQRLIHVDGNFRREKAIRDEGTSFWERMFPLQKLLEMQRLNPAVFAAQYQNDVEAMRELSPLKLEWVQSFELVQLQNYGLYRQIAIDPGGITEKEETSGMGISVIGVQTQRGVDFAKIYNLEAKCLHVDTWTAAKIVIDLWEKYQKPKIIVEEAALQRVFQDIFNKERELRGHPWIDIVGMKSSELKDKITLARGVTHFFTRGQVHIDPKVHYEFYSKLEDYPQIGTDDVNALLINLKYLKDNWVQRVEPAEQVQRREPRRSPITGY